eukprot:scaffold4229_cov30-Tisochrysis_lutea.AAC.9
METAGARSARQRATPCLASQAPSSSASVSGDRLALGGKAHPLFPRVGGGAEAFGGEADSLWNEMSCWRSAWMREVSSAAAEANARAACARCRSSAAPSTGSSSVSSDGGRAAHPSASAEAS